MNTIKVCYETGEPLREGMKDTAHFSSDAARTSWGNRRKNRGAVLYDLFMAFRYSRGAAAKLGVFALMCRLAARWHAEDKGAGRTSFLPLDEVVERNKL